MSEMRITVAQTDVVITILHTLRRATRALKRVLDAVDEDDVQRKFKGFLREHETSSKELQAHINQEFYVSDTPPELIQFPININQLLAIAAKSEKLVIDEIDDSLSIDLPQKVSEQLKQVRDRLEKSYDYIQALADIWS